MIVTQQQQKEMLEAAKPLIKWLNENCNPHCTALVDQNSIILTEDVAGSFTEEFVKN